MPGATAGTSERRRNWLVTAVALTAIVIVLAAVVLWRGSRESGRTAILTARPIALVRPVAMGDFYDPYGTWWLAQDKLYWLTEPQGAEHPSAKVLAHVIDLTTGARSRDLALTRLLRLQDRVSNDDTPFPFFRSCMLPDGRVLISRNIRRVLVPQHVADADVVYWDQSGLFLSAPPYTERLPVGPPSTWSVQAGTGGGGGGRGVLAVSNEVAVWAQGGPAGPPRPVVFGKTDVESRRSGLWVCDLETGKAHRLSAHGRPLSWGTPAQPFPRAFGSTAVWAIEDPEGELPVLSDKEQADNETAKRIRVFAWDVRTGQRTQLPVNVVDALAGDVFVGFVPSGVRFFDRRTGELWTVPSAEQANEVLAVGADGDIAAWVEWRPTTVEEANANRGPRCNLVVRACDVETRQVRTVGQAVGTTCTVRVAGDRIYWIVQRQYLEAGVKEVEGLTVYGARAWTDGGRLYSQLLRPATP